MDVQSILKMKGADVLTIGETASVNDAAVLLRENHIGAVIVTDEHGKIGGILSERDIAISLPEFGAALGDAPVGQIMTSDVITCTLSVTFQEVLDIMVANGIRHLPVVDDETLIGIISLRDVVGNWFGAIAA